MAAPKRMHRRDIVSQLLLGACLATQCRADAGTTLTFGSMVAQDELAACDLVLKCNGQFCADVCAPGSVRVDPWYTATLAHQRWLTRDRPLYAVQWVGSHNAFISRANGMGLTEDFAAQMFSRTLQANASGVRVANQRYSVTDLLNMGVRHIETDIWLTDLLFGSPKICHSPVLDPLYGVALQDSATALGLGTLNFNGGVEMCSNITLATAAQEVWNWLHQPANAQEVVGMFLDNRVPTDGIQTVTSALTGVFGSEMFTPMDLHGMFNGVWPTTSQLLAAGKRVFVESNSYVNNNYTGNFSNYVFYPTTWSAWQDDGIDVAPAPNCTINGDASWYGRDFVRILQGSVHYFPDYDERSGNSYMPNGFSDLTACGTSNIAIADFGPQVLPGLVWTWAAGEPSFVASRRDAGNCSAAAITTVRGRWTAQPCSRTLPAVCRYGDINAPAGAQPWAWNLTQPVQFAAAATACSLLGQGWTFDMPRDGRENSLLASLAAFNGVWQGTTPGIWVNFQLS